MCDGYDNVMADIMKACIKLQSSVKNGIQVYPEVREENLKLR